MTVKYITYFNSFATDLIITTPEDEAQTVEVNFNNILYPMRNIENYERVEHTSSFVQVTPGLRVTIKEKS